VTRTYAWTRSTGGRSGSTGGAPSGLWRSSDARSRRTENITLDGVIDASAGWFGVAALREQSEAADAVLFGRVTFEEMRGY
jgi:hypothetical protein